MNLVDELFSAPLMDINGCRCGRVDDVLVEPTFEQPARVVALISGGGAKSALIARWSHTLSVKMHQVLGVRPPVLPAMIPWETVKILNDHVGLSVGADELGLDALNHAAARRWIGPIPGSGAPSVPPPPPDTSARDTQGLLSLESLMSKRVRDTDGRILGRVYSLGAELRRGELHVTDLCIGAAAWLELLYPDARVRRFVTRRQPHTIPWQCIARIGKLIELK